MAWTHIRHRVADYNAWKQIFDSVSPLKREYGWKRYRVFMVNNDRSDLLVMEEFASAEEAQRYLNSEDLSNIMKKSGVVGTPEVLLLQGLEEGTL